MLTLPIKKKWFDMILSGEKKEEYREIKPYYISRFEHFAIDNVLFENNDEIKFVNGYGNNRPYFVARVSIIADEGRQEWGAEPNKRYFVLTIEEITEKGNIKNGK